MAAGTRHTLTVSAAWESIAPVASLARLLHTLQCREMKNIIEKCFEKTWSKSFVIVIQKEGLTKRAVLAIFVATHYQK